MEGGSTEMDSTLGQARIDSRIWCLTMETLTGDGFVAMGADGEVIDDLQTPANGLALMRSRNEEE